MPMEKAIITVVGKDTVGILAKTCTHLAKNEVNILDISQTVVQDYFNMMMIVDVSKCRKPFEKIGAELVRLGESLGLEIRCQKSEIFEKMHRV
jgi:ACT domain-containing protein